LNRRRFLKYAGATATVAIAVATALSIPPYYPLNAQAVQNPPLIYRLVLDQESANAGLAPVILSYVQPFAVGSLTLAMHRMAAGWYAPIEVRDLKAFDERGAPLTVQYYEDSEQRQTWTIAAGSAKNVTIQYKVYLRYFDKRAEGGGAYIGYLSSSYLLAWAGWIFLLPTNYNGFVGVTFSLPQGWVPAVPWQQQGGTYMAQAGREFAESTVGLGPLESRTTAIGKSQLTVAVHKSLSGSSSLERIFSFTRDSYSLVSEIFGAFPPERYLAVYVTPIPGGGRNDFIEAYNSQGDHVSGFDNYLMYSFVHRVFHTYNVFEPTGMSRKSGAELWFVEGCDVYYDSKIPFILGYQKNLGFMKDYLDDYRNFYGTSVDQPVALAGDYFIQEGRTDRAIFLAYHKGALVCMLLDRLIARVSNGTRSFDSVLQQMYSRFGHMRGEYSNRDIQGIASTIAGYSFSQFFQQYVFGNSKLPLRYSNQLSVDVDWEAMAADLGPLPGQPVAITQTATGTVSITTNSTSSHLMHTTMSSTQNTTLRTESPLIKELGPSLSLLGTAALVMILAATGFVLMKYKRRAK